MIRTTAVVPDTSYHMIDTLLTSEIHVLFTLPVYNNTAAAAVLDVQILSQDRKEFRRCYTYRIRVQSILTVSLVRVSVTATVALFLSVCIYFVL